MNEIMNLLAPTPATYGKGGAGVCIRFAFAPSELGILMVARTPRGICAVRLGESEAEMESNLREEFFAATLSRDDEGLGIEIEAVAGILRGEAEDLPVDIHATDFQWRVWRELRAIPHGETRSYSQLAAQMGMPKSARAVARACATNPLALVHPCHRVIGSDGNLRGFRWCIERKKRLLENEKARES
jgi:AraC family transcriptional regulator of adaptative response/methylated-DNA-[protein]-cysteine methyltransferase